MGCTSVTGAGVSGAGEIGAAGAGAAKVGAAGVGAAEVGAAEVGAADTQAGEIEPAGCAIGVMAKAPRPGFSKTRLCPPLRPDQAAALSAAFLRDISENIALAARQASIAGYIAYAPAGQEALFDGHLAAGTGLLLADGSPLMPPDVQGFGRCLLHAILAMLARGHRSAVVLNSDSPTLPTALLVRTATALAEDGDRVVLGPADDGGYYLLGMKAAHAHLFADIAWSTGAVAETTRRRAGELGLEVVELPLWYDVDDHAALLRLLEETATSRAWDRRVRSGLLPYAAPFTALALARMGMRGQDLDFAAE
jgi:rSAM/selenodomain-associated transferase 1